MANSTLNAMKTDTPKADKSDREMRSVKLEAEGSACSYEDPTVEKDRYLRTWKLSVVLISLCLGLFLVALDINVIGVATPKITSEFNSLDDIAWYGTAYLLSVTALQPSFGVMYRYFNIKAIYLLCVIAFEAGSILCAAAPSSAAFIAGRAIAGIGAAGIFQGTLGIITEVVELERRPLYQGIVISVFGISVCIGPVLGGTFTDHVNWRWCFWINVPIGAVTVACVTSVLKIRHVGSEGAGLPLREKLKRLDAPGAICFIASVCCMLLGLHWGGQELPWNSPRVIGIFVGFCLLFLSFCFLQWTKGEYATIPLRVLRQRSILMGACFLFFFGMSSYTYNFFVPIYFQTARAESATTSGVRFIALVIPQVAFVCVVGGLVSKWGYYVPYMIIGSAVASLGAGLISTLDVTTRSTSWATFLAINGAGAGSAMQIPYMAVQVVLSERDVAIGNAIAVFAWQLGGAVALSICQTLFLSSLLSSIPILIPSISRETIIHAGAGTLSNISKDPAVIRGLRQAYSNAIHNTFLLALVTSCLAFLFACGMEWRNVKQEGEKRRHIPSEQQQESC